LVWDNSYSMLTTKTIKYQIGILKEDESKKSWHIHIHVFFYLFFTIIETYYYFFSVGMGISS